MRTQELNLCVICPWLVTFFQKGKNTPQLKLLSAHNCNHGTATTRHPLSASFPAAGFFCINWDARSFPSVTCIGSRAGRVRVKSKDFSDSSYLFSPQLPYFHSKNWKHKFSSGRAEAQSICSADSGRLQTGVDDHEGMWSLQFNKPSHFTVSSEGRTKWSLYDQDYTRLLYSCLCWGSHLFKTATSNISEAQWPHLAGWSQPVENSFTSLLTVLQTQVMLGWRKGTLILLPSFLHLILLPIISYQYLFNLSHSSSARIFVLRHKA